MKFKELKFNNFPIKNNNINKVSYEDNFDDIHKKSNNISLNDNKKNNDEIVIFG